MIIVKQIIRNDVRAAARETIIGYDEKAIDLPGFDISILINIWSDIWERVHEIR